MRPIKLLHIADTADRGGGETYLFMLADRLPRDRYAFSALCPSEGPLSNRLRSIGVGVVPFAIPRLLSLAALVRLVRLFRQHRPDIVQSHGARTNLYAALAGRWARVPIIICTIHNSLYDYPISHIRRSLYLIGERLTFALSDRVVCVADALAQDLTKRSGRDPRKIQVIRNGVDLNAFDPKTVDGSTIRREFGLEKDTPLIGIVGRMTPQKGHRDLLTALVQIRAAVPAVRMLIVGDGPLREELVEYAERYRLNDCCIFTGPREDIPAIIGALDVVALPSLSEGLPFILLEAMAMGKPVVATRINGIREVVESGVTALLIPPQEPAMLAGAISALLINQELRSGLGAAARQLMKRHFSLDRMIQEVMALYEKLNEEARDVRDLWNRRGR